MVYHVYAVVCVSGYDNNVIGVYTRRWEARAVAARLPGAEVREVRYDMPPLQTLHEGPLREGGYM